MKGSSQYSPLSAADCENITVILIRIRKTEANSGHKRAKNTDSETRNATKRIKHLLWIEHRHMGKESGRISWTACQTLCIRTVLCAQHANLYFILVSASVLLVNIVKTCGQHTLTYMHKKRSDMWVRNYTVQMRRYGDSEAFRLPCYCAWISAIHAWWVIQLSSKADGGEGEFRGERDGTKGQDRMKGGDVRGQKGKESQKKERRAIKGSCGRITLKTDCT